MPLQFEAAPEHLYVVAQREDNCMRVTDATLDQQVVSCAAYESIE